MAQNELSPQFARLFFVAGLLEKSEWDNYGRQHQKNKPILDVLTQDVSLDTFRDLFNAEISFKSRLWKPAAESSLHVGLTATNFVNDEELLHLLNAFRPAVDALLAPLAAEGILNGDLVRRALDDHGAGPAGNYEWVLSEGLVAAPVVCQWFGNHEAVHTRLAALYLCLYFLKQNQLLREEDFAHCLAQFSPGRLPDLLRHVKEQLGLNSAWVAERLDNHINLPQALPAEIGALDPALRALIPQSFIRRQMVLPLEGSAQDLSVVTSDPFNIALTALLHWITGHWPRVFYAPGGVVIERINQLFARPADGADGTAATAGRKRAAAASATAEMPALPPRRESDIVVDNMSAVQLVSSLIESAIQMQTTDIHIEPVKTGMVVRFRIDGELHRIMTIPPMLVSSVISRVKVMAQMDVTERRRPQDGHFELRVETHNYDFRISTLPAIQGEKVVIRILDEARVQTGLDRLGLLPAQRQVFEGLLAQPYGLILVTGPTGSGKTSTLYAALNILNRENRNLVTIEDPVEYQVEGINQVQVDPHIGLTFSEGLRATLRQDPDVIMVGEIRDGDTAHNAIRAAMTGHLVFSTLHTNTALGAIDALVHLGSAPFMVAGSLLGIVAQRLLRKLCPACRQPQRTTPAINAQLGLEEGAAHEIFKAAGCEDCLKSGYQGRTGAFETIRIGDLLRPLIIQRKLAEVESHIREQHVLSLAEAGVQKVLGGITSVDELLRKVILES